MKFNEAKLPMADYPSGGIKTLNVVFARLYLQCDLEYSIIEVLRSTSATMLSSSTLL